MYKIIIVLFGLFMVWSGFMMFLKPQIVKDTIAKAGSTYLINYAELTIRLIVGFCFTKIVSQYGIVYELTGFFLMVTAVVLMFVPIKLHNRISVMASKTLKPIYLKFLAPVSITIGGLIIYGLF
ncbi:hypothetical protein [Flavobacterium sp. GCM10027622]|uniref:hypothetical protein n=1 Tax=unclassified Flavobacterium TaxID=196869 RepID=UPI0036D2C364